MNPHKRPIVSLMQVGTFIKKRKQFLMSLPPRIHFVGDSLPYGVVVTPIG